MEREKELCLCIKCQNAHLLLKGVNNFTKAKRLMQLNSVNQFLQLKNYMSTEDLEKHHPELNSPKKTSYYVFGKKQKLT